MRESGVGTRFCRRKWKWKERVWWPSQNQLPSV